MIITCIVISIKTWHLVCSEQFLQHFIVRLLLIGSAVLVSDAAMAQNPSPSTSGAVVPNTLNRYYEDQIRSLPKPLSRPLLQPPTDPDKPLRQDDDSISGKSIKLSGIKLKGQQQIPVAIIDKVVRPYLNQFLPVKKLSKMVIDVNKAIVDAGYILSHVIVPDQNLKDGILTLKLQETGLEEVTSEGPKLFTQSQLLDDWRSTLLSDVPLQQKTLERVLLTINQTPGITAKGTLYRTPQGMGLKLTASRKKLQGKLSVDNRGSEFVGPWQSSGQVAINGLLGLGDQLNLRSTLAHQPQELRAADITYRALLNAAGTTFTMNALRVWSKPGHTLESSRLSSINNRLLAEVSHPLIRARNSNVVARAGATIRNNRTKTFATPIIKDRTRAIQLGVQADRADTLAGISLLDVSIHQGISGLGASDNNNALASRQNGRSDFGKIEGYLSRNQAFPYGFSALAAVAGQYAFTQLLSPEEFGYGGAQFGRGYDPSEIVGDHGVAGLLELQYSPAALTNRLSANVLQFYTSYDIGMVWAIDRNTRFNSQSGASAAVGLRADLFEGVQLDLQVAKPLTRPVSAKSDDANSLRGFARINYQF